MTGGNTLGVITVDLGVGQYGQVTGTGGNTPDVITGDLGVGQCGQVAGTGGNTVEILKELTEWSQSNYD